MTEILVLFNMLSEIKNHNRYLKKCPDVNEDAVEHFCVLVLRAPATKAFSGV